MENKNQKNYKPKNLTSLNIDKNYGIQNKVNQYQQ